MWRGPFHRSSPLLKVDSQIFILTVVSHAAVMQLLKEATVCHALFPMRLNLRQESAVLIFDVAVDLRGSLQETLPLMNGTPKYVQQRVEQPRAFRRGIRHSPRKLVLFLLGYDPNACGSVCVPTCIFLR